MNIVCWIAGHRRAKALLWRRGGCWHGVCQRCGHQVIRTREGSWLSVEDATVLTGRQSTGAMA